MKMFFYYSSVSAIFILTWIPWNAGIAQMFNLGVSNSFYIVVLLAIILIWVSSKVKNVVPRWPQITGFHQIGEYQYILMSAALMMITSILGSTYIFKHVPSMGDGYAQYIQGKIFASGHLYLKSHTFPRFFDCSLIINDGRYYSQFPPGFALLLALGFYCKTPWLINPLLSALCSIAIYYLTREIGNRRAARISCLLFLSSSWIILMASEYMNSMIALLCVLCFALFYIRLHRYGNSANAVLTGNALGYLFITRPQLAVPLSLPFVVHWVFTVLN